MTSRDNADAVPQNAEWCFRLSRNRNNNDGDVVVALVVPIRLAGSSQPREGRLEVYYNSRWGTVCDDYFDRLDASVACAQLGLG